MYTYIHTNMYVWIYTYMYTEVVNDIYLNYKPQHILIIHVVCDELM